MPAQNGHPQTSRKMGGVMEEGLVAGALMSFPFGGVSPWLVREGMMGGSCTADEGGSSHLGVGFPRGAGGIGGWMEGCVMVGGSISAPITHGSQCLVGGGVVGCSPRILTRGSTPVQKGCPKSAEQIREAMEVGVVARAWIIDPPNGNRLWPVREVMVGES